MVTLPLGEFYNLPYGWLSGFYQTLLFQIAFVSYQQKSAYILAKGRPPLPQNQLLDVMSQEYRHHSNEKPVSI